VLSQLGNRVEHALRAFTPDDETALRATVRTFPNSPYDLEKLLTALGTGEAKEQTQGEHTTSSASSRDSGGITETVVKSSGFKSFLRSAGTVLGREITRTIFGARSR